MKPLVSIIVPIHNTRIEDFDTCYRSLVNQSYKRIEIILVDDGSSDCMSRQYKKYKCAKYLYHENKGVSAARNYGLDNSEGDYVIFVDSDDYIERHFVEKMVNVAIEKEAKIIVSKMRLFDSNGESRDTDYDPKNSNFKMELLRNSESYTAPGKLIKRKIIGNKRFDETMRFSEDVLFFSRLGCEEICYVDCVYFYRRSQNSSTYTFDIETARKYIVDSAKFIHSIKIKNEDECNLAGIKRITNASSRIVYGSNRLKYMDFKSFVDESFAILDVKDTFNRKQLKNMRIKTRLFANKRYRLAYILLKINKVLNYES